MWPGAMLPGIPSTRNHGPLGTSRPCRIGPRRALETLVLRRMGRQVPWPSVASVPWSLDESSPMMPGYQGPSRHRRSSPRGISGSRSCRALDPKLLLATRDRSRPRDIGHVGTEVMPRPSIPSDCRHLGSLALTFVHGLPFDRTNLGHRCPSIPWCQGSRASSDRGPDDPKAPGGQPPPATRYLHVIGHLGPSP